jgi:hypothetical protein
MAAAVEALELALLGVGVGELPDDHGLRPADLQQEVVLRVEVGGRRGVRGGKEDEALALAHAAIAVGHERAHLVERRVQQLRVLGVGLDVLEDHPAAVRLDRPGDLARRGVDPRRLAAGQHGGDAAEVVLDVPGGQRVGEDGETLGVQQRMVHQLVAHRVRAAP